MFGRIQVLKLTWWSYITVVIVISVQFVLNKMDVQGQGLLVGHLARGLEIQAETNVESATGENCMFKGGKQRF